MKFLTSILFPLLSLSLVCSSCYKKEDEIQTMGISQGGKGGVAIIKATPIFETMLVDSCTVYIKYNMLEAPGNGAYDDSAVCVLDSGKPVATFSRLRSGNYFLYGKGWNRVSARPLSGGYAWTVVDTINTNNVTIPLSE